MLKALYKAVNRKFYKGFALALCVCVISVSMPYTAYAQEEQESVQTSASEEPAPAEEPEEKPQEPEKEPESESHSDTPSPEPDSSNEPSYEQPSEQPSESSAEPSKETQESSTEEKSGTEQSTEEKSSTEQPGSSEEKSTEEKSTEEKSTEEKSTEEKTTEEKSSEEKSTEKKSTEEISEETSEEETITSEETTTAEDETDVTELKLSVSKQITVQTDKSNAAWFKFKATESGYYNFYADGGDVSGVTLSVYDARKDGKQLKKQTYQDNVRYALVYIEKDVTVYPTLSLAESGNVSQKTVLFGVKRVKTATVQSSGEGYSASADSFTADIGWKTGSRTVSASFTINAKSGKNLNRNYIWQIKYGNSDIGWQYINETVQTGVKKDRNLESLEAGQDYSFSMYLVNADTLGLEAVIIPESAPIRMSTGSSTDNVIIKSTYSSYDSITVNIEAVDTVSKYCYGLVADYDNEISVQKRISGVAAITATDLQPAATYYFEFYNTDGIVISYITVDTKEYPAKVNYSVRATGPDSVYIKADISSYTGKLPEYFNLCYEISDTNGTLIETGMEKKEVSDKDAKRWQIETEVLDLEAAAEYQVLTWITEPAYTAHFKQSAKNVTTDKAPFEKNALNIKISEKSDTKADYSISIEEYDKNTTGKLKYRMKNSLGEYNIRVINIRNGATKGTITGLQTGAEYEYEVRISGVVKKGTFKVGEAAINPIMSDDTGAYDSIITYRLDGKEAAKFSTKNTALNAKLYYYNDETKLYAEMENKLEIKASGEYSVSVQAADYFDLSPDTVYGFKWELYNGTSLINTQYQLVTTAKSEVTVELTSNLADSVTYDLAINGRTDNINRDITLFTYICEEGGEYRKSGDSFNLYASKSYKAAGRTLSGLDDDRTYTVSFRDIKGKEYGSYTFTFEARIDGVRVSVTSEVAGAHNIALNTLIEGEVSPESYLILFFKEQNEQDWDIRSVQLYENQTECSFDLTSYLGDDINSDTIYEYVTGISSKQYPKAAETLEGSYSSEILTQTDGRSLTNVTAGSGYSYISIKAMLTNNPLNTSSYIYVFYREKGERSWIKSKKSFIISQTTGGILTFINDLKPCTEYEYIVAVSDMSYNVSLDDIEEDRMITGTVMTRNDEFEVRTMTEGDVFSLKADTASGAKHIKAVVTLSDDTTEEIMLSQDKDYTDTLTLKEGISVKEVVLKVMETVTGQCSYVTVGKKDVF